MNRCARCECDCCATLLLWAANLQDEGMEFEPEELEAAEVVIFVSLACIAKHSPNRKMRAYAKNQLRDPFWNEQKQLECHTTN
jgi:hypothetical protein